MTQKKRPSFTKPKDLPVRLPFAPGQVVQLTEGERKTLEALGWQDGEPLPGPEFASALAKGRARLEQETQDEMLRAARQRPSSIRPARELDIEDLPPERKHQLKSLLEKAKERAESETPDGMHPSVASAIKELREDRVKKVEPPPAAEETKEPSEPAAPNNAGGAAPPTRCPHCEWELSKPDERPDKEDALLFLQAVLGGQRFVKEYSFLGGALKATFGTLTTEEANLCLRQCGLDTSDGKIKSLDDLLASLVDYRLSLSIQSITTNDVEEEVAPAAQEFLRENGKKAGGDTPLPGLLEEVRRLVPLNQETVWRIMGQSFQRFNRLVGALEARADQPDFWQAIGG